MNLSLFLVSILPVLALSWHHPSLCLLEAMKGRPTHLSKTSLPSQSAPPRLSHLQSLPLPSLPQFQNDQPFREDYTVSKSRLATPTQKWMQGKRKRVQSVTAYGATPSSTPSVPVSPWIDQQHRPRRVLRLGEDYFLYDTVHVPSGTILRWYKDDDLVQREGDSATSEVTTGDASRAFVTIESGIFLDCCDADVAGTYRLDVSMPNSGVVQRNYTVILVDDNAIQGATCSNNMSYYPRIYEFAPQAVVPLGESVILPCGFQGLNSVFAWYLNSTLISPQDPNHELKANGHLLIRQWGGGSAQYVCQVFSTIPEWPVTNALLSNVFEQGTYIERVTTTPKLDAIISPSAQ